jgi:hypothetical protein
MFDWLFEKKKVEEKPVKAFYVLFDPQTDITAYELATMHKYIPGFWDGMESYYFNKGLHQACFSIPEDKNLDAWRNTPSSIRRHFRIVDSPVRIEEKSEWM